MVFFICIQILKETVKSHISGVGSGFALFADVPHEDARLILVNGGFCCH